MIADDIRDPSKMHLFFSQVERGLSWAEIQEKWAELSEDLEGFYISHQVTFDAKFHGRDQRQK